MNFIECKECDYIDICPSGQRCITLMPNFARTCPCGSSRSMGKIKKTLQTMQAPNYHYIYTKQLEYFVRNKAKLGDLLYTVDERGQTYVHLCVSVGENTAKPLWTKIEVGDLIKIIMNQMSLERKVEWCIDTFIKTII